jgi:hypothetical protein
MLSAFAVVAAGVVVASGSGYPEHLLDSVSGALWLASSDPGQVALVDGPTGEVVVQLAVATPGDDLVSAQSGETGYVVNRTMGSLERIDAGTWQVGQPSTAIEGAGAGLAVVTSPTALYAVDGEQGLLVELERESLRRRGSERSLTGGLGPAAPVIDDDGDLWLLDARRGDLVHVDGTIAIAARAAADPAAGRLVTVAGRPVVVDPEAGTAVQYDQDGHAGNHACVDVDPADTDVHYVGSTTRPEVYAVSGTSGVLRISDLRTGACDLPVARLAEKGSDLGQPVELARRVFVPNRTTGQVVVVDLDSRRVLVTTEPVVDPGAPFDLTAKDGFVFYNDTTSEDAGVIDLDGGVRATAKYDPGEPEKDLTPVEPATPPTDLPEPASPAPSGSPPTEPPDRSAPATRPRSAPVPVPVPQPGSQATASTPPERAPAATTPTELRVTLGGTGAGTVHVVAGGLLGDCPASCTFPLTQGAAATVEAVPAPGSEFTGWTNVACAASSCALTLGVGATTSDPPGVNTVTASFALLPPPPAPTFDVSSSSVDLASSNEVVLTVTGGTGAESWTASGPSWLALDGGGTFDASGTAHVGLTYAAGRQASAPNGLTPGAVTFLLLAGDSSVLDDATIALTSDGAPTLSNAHCELIEGAGQWNISVEARDATASSITVAAVLTPAAPDVTRNIDLIPNGPDAWLGTEVLPVSYSVAIRATDVSNGLVTPNPATLTCGG